jgi:protein SCO1/2
MRLLISAVSIALACTLSACGPAPSSSAPKFQATDVTGANFGKSLALTDHTGKPRTLADFQGKVVVVFFGFTQCPDVCPTTLAEMAKVVKELGGDGNKVQVLFVSVDAERDTPELLRQYVTAFHPSFLGLVGDAEATVRTAKEFKVYVQKQPTKGGSYSVDHSAGTFILDQQGRLRLFVQYGAGAPALLNDIKILLKQAA